MSKTIYTKDPSRFYVYAFLREDDTPYYIGKGTGNRAWIKRRRISPPADVSRISILFENLTETEAFSEEIRLIEFYGRQDLGTGCLRNLTDGGEGSSGRKHTPETLAKMSEAKQNQSAETLAKLSAARTGKHHTQESRDKMSAAKTGKKQSAETRAKRSAALSGEKNPNFGKKQSAETIAKRLATMARNKEATAEIFI